MNWKRNQYLMGWTWSVTSIIFGWLHNRCDMWKKRKCESNWNAMTLYFCNTEGKGWYRQNLLERINLSLSAGREIPFWKPRLVVFIYANANSLWIEKETSYLMGWTWSVTSIIFGWLYNRCDMWKKENVNLIEMQWPYIFAIRREKDDTDRIFRKGLIFLFQPVAKYLFESRDSYVVTYKAMYVSTKNSVKLNPYSKLWSGVDLTPSSFFCLVKTI